MLLHKYEKYIMTTNKHRCSNRLEDKKTAGQSKNFKQFAVDNFTRSVQFLCACFERLIDKGTQIYNIII